ncbi:hypothetical protein WH96_01280 [Kiloniella spongiae]|uniref:OmpA-like domain-containing protein n=1 Tax=Kiloniella spongiae TaxID=1489064 RepID=A0A0H2MZU3_9PROT|nr:OmpA family protein [Kiloniella spongiae]KLN62190.1 hypothetical protein WH96_01280 [Kiloniella spongiae]
MVRFLVKYFVSGVFVLGGSISSAVSSPVDCSVPVDQSPLVTKVIYFEVGQSSLSKKAQKKIDDLFNVIDGHPSLKICAIGQADKQGDPDANKKLSLKRAQSAKNYLIKKGIAKKRIETVFRGEAYGSFSLWGSGEKADEDRRVEVIAYKE